MLERKNDEWTQEYTVQVLLLHLEQYGNDCVWLATEHATLENRMQVIQWAAQLGYGSETKPGTNALLVHRRPVRWAWQLSFEPKSKCKEDIYCIVMHLPDAGILNIADWRVDYDLPVVICTSLPCAYASYDDICKCAHVLLRLVPDTLITLRQINPRNPDTYGTTPLLIKTPTELEP